MSEKYFWNLFMIAMTFSLKAITNRLMPTPADIYRSFSPSWLFAGCLSLYGYIFLKLPLLNASRFFLGVMLIAFFVSVVKAPRQARRDPVWGFVIAAIFISLFIYLWSHAFFPAYAGRYPATDKLLNLCLFFPVAWWLGGQRRNVLWFLAAALIGFVIDLLINGGLKELAMGLSGSRVDFSMRNAQHTAIFFSVALMGWVIFVKQILGGGGRRKILVRSAVWMFGLAVFGTGVIVTQTRAAWIGVSVALFIVGLVVVMCGNVLVRQKIIGLLVTLLVSGMIISPLSTTIDNRFVSEKEVIQQLIAGKTADIPYSSTGIRIHTWIEAWQWIKQRPITGWGYAVRGKVIRESEVLPPQVTKHFGHFHNSYIEILLSYGMLGILFIAGLFYLVTSSAVRAWRSGVMPSDVFLFGVAFTVFWMIVNLFESYFLWSTGVYLMALVGGCLYTFTLSGRLRV